MKTKLFLIASLISVGLIFISCQKDNSLMEETSNEQLATNNKALPESQNYNPWGHSLDSVLLASDRITNYPDPFNMITTIAYMVPGKETWINLKVYNKNLELVAELVDELQGAGKSMVTFNASGLPDGRYIAEIKIGQSVYREKMTKKSLILESDNGVASEL